MLRRAALPFASTNGYHPQPRLVFALSLGLGIEGYDEVVDLELEAPLPEREVFSRLANQAPEGLKILSVRAVHDSSAPQVSKACYEIIVPTERQCETIQRIDKLLAAEHVWIKRDKPKPREIDIRPFIDDLRLTANKLVMRLRMTPEGSARPLEILQILQLDDLIAAGGVLQRTALELHET